MTTKPSTNPIVVKIENILKNKYGVETALLNDDVIRAKNILKSVKKLKENNIPIPDEYIVSDFLLGARFLRLPDKQKSTVLLSSNKNNDLYAYIKAENSRHFKQEQKLVKAWEKQCGFKNWNSSDAVEHVESHEAIHGTHPFILAFRFQKLENIFLKTIKKISGYSAFNVDNINEIYTELKTKSLYVALEPAEQKLLNILDT